MAPWASMQLSLGNNVQQCFARLVVVVDDKLQCLCSCSFCIVMYLGHLRLWSAGLGISIQEAAQLCNKYCHAVLLTEVNLSTEVWSAHHLHVDHLSVSKLVSVVVTAGARSKFC